MKSKYTLLIDGNHFLFRSLYTIKKGPSDKSLLLSNDTEVGIYIRKLSIDLAYIIRLFEPIIDSVVWTVDSRSWRKDFYPSSNYKGTRTSDSNLDWDSFTKVSTEFMNILSSNGIIISKVDGAEGDDLLYFWSSYLSSTKSSIIVSGDNDMIQLVNHNSYDSTKTIVYSPIKKLLIAPIGFNQWLSETDTSDIFESLTVSSSMMTIEKNTIRSIISQKDISYSEIDSNLFKFIKILIGDSGDNVPSVYWYTKTDKNGNERTYNVTERKAKIIVSEFLQRNPSCLYSCLFSDDLIVQFANIAIRVLNAKFMSREQIIKNIKSNINLTILDSKTIPSEISDSSYSHIESILGNKISLNLPNLKNMKKLLEGTKYIDKPSAVQIEDTDDSDYSFIKK